MKTTLPLLAYIPMDLLCDGDFKMRMSEKAEEVARLVDIEIAERL